MVIINFLGPINKEPIKLEAKTLKEVAISLQQDETLKEWLKNCAVAVNDKVIKDLDYKLKDGDNIFLLPPVCGG